MKESVANKHRFPKRRQQSQQKPGKGRAKAAVAAAEKQKSRKQKQSETTTSCSIHTTSHMTQPTNRPSNNDDGDGNAGDVGVSLGCDNGYIHTDIYMHGCLYITTATAAAPSKLTIIIIGPIISSYAHTNKSSKHMSLSVCTEPGSEFKVIKINPLKTKTNGRPSPRPFAKIECQVQSKLAIPPLPPTNPPFSPIYFGERTAT